MAIQAGSYKLGPDNATLRVKTGRTGPAAKAGHNLVIEVKAWEATLDVGEDAAASSLALTADPTSLHVIEGSGGAAKLDDGDKDDIRKTIGKDVLKKTDIAFQSTSVADGPDGLAVAGELTIGKKSTPIEFVVSEDGDRVTASAAFKQTDVGISPYSAMWGALKVVDEVTVEAEGSLA
jgi:polyisoprenoid-binding protein YceI